MIDDRLVPDGYEGWVAWINGSPVFEAVPHNSRLAQLVPGARALPTRFEARDVREWKDLPNVKIERFELYFARDRFPGQPVMRMDREPGATDLRFLQMKMGGLLVNRPLRLGLNGYRVGYWSPQRKHPKGGIGFCQMWEIRSDGSIHDLEPVRNPFAPRPNGYGYSRDVAGADVP